MSFTKNTEENISTINSSISQKLIIIYTSLPNLFSMPIKNLSTQSKHSPKKFHNIQKLNCIVIGKTIFLEKQKNFKRKIAPTYKHNPKNVEIWSWAVHNQLQILNPNLLLNSKICRMINLTTIPESKINTKTIQNYGQMSTNQNIPQYNLTQ